MIEFKPIGVIHTPYDSDFTPHQPVERDGPETSIELDDEYTDALTDLAEFSHIYVLFHLHDMDRPIQSIVAPPWAKGQKVGLFASRTPVRPNPIGLSIVKLKRIEDSTLFTSAIDAHDLSPVIDIKPYIGAIDAKPEANIGWMDRIENATHVLEHLRGVPHDHDHDHHHHHHDHHDHDHHDR